MKSSHFFACGHATKNYDPKPTQQPTAPTAEEVQRARLYVRKKLEAAEAESIATGKPLTILIGEQHDYKHSMLLTAIIYDEARKLKHRPVRTVAVESPPPGFDESNTEAQALRKYRKDLEWMNEFAPTGMQMVAGMAEDYFHHTVTHIDIHATDDDKKDTSKDGAYKRSVGMAGLLSTITHPTLAVVGRAHLDEMHRYGFDRLRKTHTIVDFDTRPDVPGSQAPELWLRPGLKNGRMRELSDARELTVGKILELGFGKKTTDDYYAFLERSNRIAPEEMRSKEVQQTRKYLADNPADFDERRYLTDMLYDGFDPKTDAEAGRQEALATITCQVTKNESCIRKGVSGDQRNFIFRNTNYETYKELKNA